MGSFVYGVFRLRQGYGGQENELQTSNEGNKPKNKSLSFDCVTENLVYYTLYEEGLVVSVSCEIIALRRASADAWLVCRMWHILTSELKNTNITQGKTE